MSESTLSLYDSKSKIFCFSEKGAQTVQREIAEDGFFDLYRVHPRSEGAALRAVDPHGREHVFYGPANGASVFLREADDADESFDEIVDLWTSSGLGAPATLNTTELARESLARRVTESLVTQLEKELAQVSSNAIGLDKQIAVLREDLEDYRRHVDEIQLVRRLSGDFPILAFERKPTRSTQALGGDVVAQLLPYPGSTVSAIGFGLSNVVASGGVLDVRLVAREDDSVLASWELDASTLQEGWNAVSVARRIPTRYRFVDLQVRWKGLADAAPRLQLADAFGDAEGFASVAGAPTPNQMLALRAWTGARFDEEVAAEHARFPSDRDRLTAPLLCQGVPDAVLKTVEGLSEGRGDRKWLRSEGNGILVHPTAEGPSVAALSVPLTAPMTAVTLSASVEHRNSRPVSFRVVVVDAASDEHLRYVENPDLEGQDVLFEGEWSEVLPCTERPLVCRLSTSAETAKVLLMTKVPDGNDSFAHAWFRNVRVAC